jgi:ABC-type multidrug transport system ATPase subunit
MAAHLRLPKELTDSEREAAVDALIARLGMAKSTDTIVGDAKVRGLSGGEKKRLSIGCELLASPQLVFADEPTTGLDSFQAERVSCDACTFK